jgi:hypothetical protein
MEKTAPPPADLEASPDVPAKQESSIARRWKQNLTTTHADLVCLLLCFLTGLCDSSAYNAWSCFLGMQTGMNQSVPDSDSTRGEASTITSISAKN